MPNDVSVSAPTTVAVTLAPALVRLFPEAPRQVALTAATVDELVDALDARWPGMGDRLRDSRPSIRRHINVFVEGKRAKLETRLAPGTEVFVLTAISGG
jgi:molybdopterin converting factor small subunit